MKWLFIICELGSLQWKKAGETCGPQDAPGHLSVHVVTGSNSTIQSNYRTSRIPKYCFPDRQRSAFVFHSWNQAFRILGFLGSSANITPSWWREQREGRLIWPYYAFPVITCPDCMNVTPSLSHFSVVVSNQKLSNAAVPWMMDLWSSLWTVFVKTGSSEWILSSAVTFDAVFYDS